MPFLSSIFSPTSGIDIKEADVIVNHPYHLLEIPLETWIAEGPGDRDLLRPIAVIHNQTRQELPIHLIPFACRNTRLSRSLIKLGIVKAVWPV
jgi:hypothetical protein